MKIKILLVLISTILMFNRGIEAQVKNSQIGNIKFSNKQKLPLFRVTSLDFYNKEKSQNLSSRSQLNSDLTAVLGEYANNSYSLNVELSVEKLKVNTAKLLFEAHYNGDEIMVYKKDHFLKVVYPSRLNKSYHLILELNAAISNRCQKPYLVISSGGRIHNFPLKNGFNRLQFILDSIISKDAYLTLMSKGQLHCNKKPIDDYTRWTLRPLKVRIKELKS